MASVTERHAGRCGICCEGGGGWGCEGTAEAVGASRVDTATSSNDEARIVGCCCVGSHFAGLKKVAAWAELAEARIGRGEAGPGLLGNILRAFPAHRDVGPFLRADEAVTLPKSSPTSVSDFLLSNPCIPSSPPVTSPLFLPRDTHARLSPDPPSPISCTPSITIRSAICIPFRHMHA
jgi:hypothetical protein